MVVYIGGYMKYGWKADLPDIRDYLYSMQPVPIPTRIDLTTTGYCPPVYDQGNLGSCTANAGAGMVDFIKGKQKQKWITPSRLFLYYNTRELEGTVDWDSGATIRNTIKALVKCGVCGEDLWPYDIGKFADIPTAEAYAEAEQHQALVYRRLNNENINELKNCIAAGYPFIFGMAVYQSFYKEVNETGRVNLPDEDESMLGGHAIMCVGYNDKVRRCIIRNSWGANFGKGGYFSLPYEYITNPNLCGDFWVVTKEE
jgi:C1A family cysteine protease